jgi:hypothetical protein
MCELRNCRCITIERLLPITVVVVVQTALCLLLQTIGRAIQRLKTQLLTETMCMGEASDRVLVFIILYNGTSSWFVCITMHVNIQYTPF